MSDEVNLRRVRYFNEAARAGTVRAAADRLNAAPSVVSRQITQLEEDLAVPLLERNRRGVKPTEAGELLLRYYREHLAHEEALVSHLRELRGLQRGNIRLAVGEGFIGDLMSHPMSQFAERYPGLTVSVEMAGTNEVIRLVTEDEAHIGLLYHPPKDPNIRSHKAVRQPLSVIIHPDHTLARSSQLVTLPDLVQYPVGFMQESYGTRQVLQMAENAARVRFSPVLTTNSIAALKNFVRSGRGIAFLPAFAVALELEDGVLSAVPVSDPILQTAEAHIITRLGRQLSAAAHRLLVHISSTMRAFQSE